MKTARRNFLLLGGGAAAGAVFTPVPWKLLDDVSIWSQNWSWIPRPLTGEIKQRHTVCTLCPAACGVRARCVGAQPIALAGVPNHPLSGGRLCAIGLGAHQLPYHPQRTPALPAEATAALKAKLAAKPRTVLLDLVPGRAASAIYSRLEDIQYTTLHPSPAEPSGYDVPKARTIVSFGAPVLETWGPVLAAWSSAERPRVIQVDSGLSRSATLADVWLPVRPGTEEALARALAGDLTPEAASQHCGIDARRITEAIHWMKTASPVLAAAGESISAGARNAIANLNSGSDAVVRRAASPISRVPSRAWSEVENGSIELLLIDHGPVASSPGWEVIAPKLARNAYVVSFSPFAAGDAERANAIVPAPAWLEAADDAIESPESPVPTYSVAPALLTRPAGAVDPVDLLTGGNGARDAEIRARIEAIHQAGKGEVFAFADAASKPVKEFPGADELAAKFNEGAVWIGEAGSRPQANDAPPVPTLAAAPMMPAAAVLPSLTSKLFQESRLYKRTV